MSEGFQELASRYRDILRQSVFLVRSMDAEGDLSIGQVSTLNMVSTGPKRVGVIASNSGVRVPSATEQIIKLELAGLVERTADASDARVVLVGITPLGRARLKTANGRRSASMARAMEALSQDEQQAIDAAIPALAKLNAALVNQLATAHDPTVPQPGAHQPTTD